MDIKYIFMIAYVMPTGVQLSTQNMSEHLEPIDSYFINLQ